MADIFGIALKDYYKGNLNAKIIVKSKHFEDDFIPVKYLFRTYKEMPVLEQKALEMCLGSVLDVGCCAGSHSLYLQNEKQLEVTSIDTSKGAITTCKKRGLKTTICQPFIETKGTFDTIVMLMNGTGIIGTLQDIPEFFSVLRNLLNANGQVLIDSSDLIYLYNEDDLVEGYYGQMEYQLQYKSKISKPFTWLFLDKENLIAESALHNFKCTIIYEGNHFEYLARLTLA